MRWSPALPFLHGGDGVRRPRFSPSNRDQRPPDGQHRLKKNDGPGLYTQAQRGRKRRCALCAGLGVGG
eukprot:scaffold21044_cov124-Isochrysis_galbana.AAC.2